MSSSEHTVLKLWIRPRPAGEMHEQPSLTLETGRGVLDAAAGLKNALRPEGRAGIWGQVLRGGTLQLGDRLVVDPG